MIKLQKQTLPSKIYVQISGETRKEVIENFWLFLNHGAVNLSKKCILDEIADDSDFTWLQDDKIGYFITNEENLLKGLKSICWHRIVDKQDKHLTNEMAENMGQRWFNEIVEARIE